VKTIPSAKDSCHHILFSRRGFLEHAQSFRIAVRDLRTPSVPRCFTTLVARTSLPSAGRGLPSTLAVNRRVHARPAPTQPVRQGDRSHVAVMRVTRPTHWRIHWPPSRQLYQHTQRLQQGRLPGYAPDGPAASGSHPLSSLPGRVTLNQSQTCTYRVGHGVTGSGTGQTPRGQNPRGIEKSRGDGGVPEETAGPRKGSRGPRGDPGTAMALPLQASIVILGCLFCLRCGDCERWRWNRRRSVRDNLRFSDVVTARLFVETETTPDTDSSHRSDSPRHQPSTP
jgi:hypothetical protein